MGRCGKSVKKTRRMIQTRAESISNQNSRRFNGVLSKQNSSDENDYVENCSDIEDLLSQERKNTSDCSDSSDIVAEFEDLRTAILCTQYGHKPKLFGAQV
jgi:hypothetical protein